MYQLMIVDDEPTAVDSLAETIAWSELAISAVFRAYSAKEALQLAEVERIDILITDIRMPGMNGIELIRRIRESNPRTACALVTGHAEFDYAQQAIQLQTADYLLKPVSDERLIAVVKAIVDRLGRDREQYAAYRLTQMALQEQMPALRANLLREQLGRRPHGSASLDGRLELFGLPFRCGDALVLALVRLDGDARDSSWQDRGLFDFAVRNLAEETFRPHFAVWSCLDAHELFVLAAVYAPERMTPEEARATAVRLGLQLQHNAKHYLKSELSVVVGGGGRLPDEIGELYREALAVMRRGIGADTGLFVTVDAQQEPPVVPALQSLHQAPSLVHLFEAGVFEEVRRKLGDVFAELAAAPGVAREHLSEVYHTVVAAGYHCAHVNGKTFADWFGKAGFEPAQPPDAMTLAELREWAFGLCDRLFRENRKDILDSRKLTIARVIDFIHAHLEEDVSLQRLAGEANWHPVYLSKVFKLETREGLSEYLFRVRMERAVQLLATSEMKIYEVTAKVGYLNVPHFIKVFKKTFGVTPQEYREQARTND
ncbi:response regulator [Paenibacillus cymbidii]|uniref:response regulator n=1 Tax=Paenibacillus cymbidii TaxID=1639034 RepID=UPI001080FFE9|nr:response regulator [Paenibacillus cymbidii]